MKLEDAEAILMSVKTLDKMKHGKGILARLRYGDVPVRTSMAAAEISRFWRPFDEAELRIILAVTAAYIRSGFHSGTLSLAGALEIADADIRGGRRTDRLLSCRSREEIAALLPGYLTYLAGKGLEVDYVRTLTDLCNFEFNPHRFAVGWAIKAASERRAALKDSETEEGGLHENA